MEPSDIGVPNFQCAVCMPIRTCANQLVRSSEPSTDNTKSFCALIWLSHLIGGISSDEPMAAFLKASVMSGRGCGPAPDVMRPSLISIQRPTSSSRALICATKLRSFSRAAKAGYLHAANFSITDRPKRMIENFNREIMMLTFFGTANRQERWSYRIAVRVYTAPDHKLMQIAGKPIDSNDRWPYPSAAPHAHPFREARFRLLFARFLEEKRGRPPTIRAWREISPQPPRAASVNRTPTTQSTKTCGYRKKIVKAST